MSTQKMERTRNRAALSSVIWGVAAMVILFGFRNSSNGLFLLLGALAGLVAIWTGIAGTRKSSEMARRGRIWGIAGMIIGVVAVLAAIVLYISPTPS